MRRIWHITLFLQAGAALVESQTADISNRKLRHKREYYEKVWWIELERGQLKGEADPEADLLYSGHAQNLVASSFERVVKNLTLDVLVNCYAPWCGHSKKIHPIFEQLAKDLHYVHTLAFARIDCTKNTIPVMFHGYPAILLFPGGEHKTSVKRYMDNKTVSGLLGWLRANVQFNFTGQPDIHTISHTVAAADEFGDADDL